MGLGDTELAVRMGLIAIGGGRRDRRGAVASRSVGRSERLRLLDSVGAVADGSLPLAETLRRVTEVIVPGLSDICMVDAVHEGQVSRLATRARGRDDATRSRQRLRNRPPALPNGWCAGNAPGATSPEWRPRVATRSCARMARSTRTSSFCAGRRPLDDRRPDPRPRPQPRRADPDHRLVGTAYGAEDVRFGEILASRIGLALDNAGLFSDLESIERRMDTVMAILDEAIMIHGADGELVFANPAAASMLGYRTTRTRSRPRPRRSAALLDSREQGNEVARRGLAGAARCGPSERPSRRRCARPIARPGRSAGRVARRRRSRAGGRGPLLGDRDRRHHGREAGRVRQPAARPHRRAALALDDYRGTLERIPQLLVPEFADWCSIEIPRDDGLLQRVAMAHHDPARLPLICGPCASGTRCASTSLADRRRHAHRRAPADRGHRRVAAADRRER